MESTVSAGAAVARSAAVLGVPFVDPPSISLAVDAVDLTARPPRCPEIECLRGVIGADAIKAAERRAAMLGIGADRVLIASGAISEESYLHTLAGALDVPFETLDDVVRAQCPLSNERLIESAAAGILPLMDNGELCSPSFMTPRTGRSRTNCATLYGRSVPAAANLPACRRG